jgi:hypothetical protein
MASNVRVHEVVQTLSPGYYEGKILINKLRKV